MCAFMPLVNAVVFSSQVSGKALVHFSQVVEILRVFCLFVYCNRTRCMLWKHFLPVCDFPSSQQCHCRVENSSEVISEFTPSLVYPFFAEVNVEYVSPSVISLDILQLELIFMKCAVCLDSSFMCRCPFLSAYFTLLSLFLWGKKYHKEINKQEKTNQPVDSFCVAPYFRVILFDLLYWTSCLPHSTFLQLYSKSWHHGVSRAPLVLLQYYLGCLGSFSFPFTH